MSRTRLFRRDGRLPLGLDGPEEGGRASPAGELSSAVSDQPSSGVGSGRARFSVVIPAHNEARYLGDCLRSLAAQDFDGDYEVLVVDNASTDSSVEIAQSFDAAVVREGRLGVCFARQAGTLVASGEIVVSTDADTTFPGDWLRRIDAVFHQNPAVVAVAGPCRYVGGPSWAWLYPRILFGFVHAFSWLTGRVCYVTATNLAFRQSAWDGYDTAMTQGGDELDALRRLRARGQVVFDPGNATSTSARRLHRGLAYSVVVTFLYYYVLAYWMNRVAGRTMIGTAPPVRNLPRGRGRAWPICRAVAVVLCLLVALALALSEHLPMFA